MFLEILSHMTREELSGLQLVSKLFRFEAERRWESVILESDFKMRDGKRMEELSELIRYFVSWADLKGI
jgi:hypothetical protein